MLPVVHQSPRPIEMPWLDTSDSLRPSDLPPGGGTRHPRGRP